MSVDLVILMVIGVIGPLATLFCVDLILKKRYSGLNRLSAKLDDYLGSKENEEMIDRSVQSFFEVSQLAQTTNAILNNEEAFEGLLTNLATKIRTSFQRSLMGTESGNVRKKEKAERLAQDAIIHGIKEFNPMIGMALKATGLDEELQKDPELLGYILQYMTQNGGISALMAQAPALQQQIKPEQKTVTGDSF